MNIKNLFSTRAKEVLEEDLFWDTSNEFAPFGNDEGFDAFANFKKWVESNPDKDVTPYIKSKLKRYNFEEKHLYETNVDLLDPVTRNILIEELDNEIIAICFGQLILKGCIDSFLKDIGRIVLERQSSESVLNYLIDDNELKIERKAILEAEIEVLEKLS